ncbi:MAG: hypothetical protein LBO78_02310, partial [Rickettsiales bacterium]|nr:hypothetical protein [Rickettsiales bacterium]
GYGEIFEIRCGRCGSFISKYQKDGHGELMRMYHDRIIEPDFPISFGIDKKLACPKCGKMLGLGYMYGKENRQAWKLFQGSVKKIPVSAAAHAKCLFLGLFKR